MQCGQASTQVKVSLSDSWVCQTPFCKLDPRRFTIFSNIGWEVRSGFPALPISLHLSKQHKAARLQALEWNWGIHPLDPHISTPWYRRMLVPGFVIGLAKQEIIPESILDQMSRGANLGMCSACSAASLKGPAPSKATSADLSQYWDELKWSKWSKNQSVWGIVRIALLPREAAAYVEYALNTLVIQIQLYSWAKHKSVFPRDCDGRI